MRKKKFWLIILLLFVCLCDGLRAERIQLHHINTKGYAVRVVYRDSNGVVWLGTTSGLLSLPQLESRNPTGYSRSLGDVNMSIRRICGDSQGRLWIKTIYNNNYCYDPLCNKFVEDTYPMLSGKGIDVQNEFTMMSDKEGCLWIWKDSQLYWIKNNADKAEFMDIVGDDQLRNVYRQDGILMVLSNKNLYQIAPEKKEILQTIPLPEGYNLREHLFLSVDGTPWIWASNMVWKYKDDQWRIVIQANSDISVVTQDHENRLWIGTLSDGIYLCDSNGSMLLHLTHTPEDDYGLLSNRVEAVSYEPVSQSVWIAYTKGGLSVFSEKAKGLMLHDILDLTTNGTSTDVLSFAPAKSRRGMWIGLEERGVWLHDAQGDKNIISGGSAVTLYASENEDLWVGIYRQGLVCKFADGQEQLFLEGSSPYAIAEDEQHNIFAALLGNGVWMLDPGSGEVIDTHLSPKFVLDLKYHQKKLYAATTEGLYVMDNQQQWTLLNDGHFRFLSIDQQGNLWLIGNEGSEGLTLLDPNGQQVDLPNDLINAPLKSIAIDKDGNVWITSSAELLLLRYHPEEKDPLERYSFDVIPEPQQVFYNPHTAYVDEDGILWLGATTGYQCIDTHHLTAQTKEKTEARQLLLGAISINDNILSPSQCLDGRILLDRDVVFIHELDLQYNENNLVIECSQSCNDGYVTDAYFYQLKGLSDVWHPLEGNAIILSNLPPGNYQLLTRTQSSEPFQLLTIRIASPFWLSWWAFCLYILIIGIIIYSISRYYHNHRAYQLKLRKLQLQQEQQSQMNELKLRFFTNISHDLRTPLSLIIGPVEELLKNNKLDIDTLHYSLNMVYRNAQNLLSLVNQILDFRRLEFGKEKLLLSYGDIVSLLRDTCESFRLKAEKDQIRFAFMPIVEQVETMFDRDKTTKIMMNLLSNAFKFTNAGGSITVRLDISSGQIIISVADTGVGITDQDKEHLFERFYQSNQDNRASMGSGIGLHIVREYVQLQGGIITVYDNLEDGQGSVFCFTLPLKKIEDKKEDRNNEYKEDELAPKENADDRQEAQISYETQLPTLLLVDDNQDLLDYMDQSLHGCYQIQTAYNGAEALALLNEKDVDLIISDIMMPGIDGLELCQRVKNDIETSHIPVLLLTAKTMTSDELKGLEAGADDYVTKPFSMDIMRQRIHNLIERSRQKHERFAKEIDIEPSEITVTSLDEQFIARAIAIVEEHITDPDFSVEQLSEEIGVHRAQLYKKLQHLTGKSPLQFIRLLRLKRGKQLLEHSGLYVSEVAYKVGFNSPRIFSKYFKEEFGITPKDFSTQE